MDIRTIRDSPKIYSVPEITQAESLVKRAITFAINHDSSMTELEKVVMNNVCESVRLTPLTAIDYKKFIFDYLDAYGGRTIRDIHNVKIRIIKELRAIDSSFGLKEAKDIVDKYEKIYIDTRWISS